MLEEGRSPPACPLYSLAQSPCPCGSVVLNLPFLCVSLLQPFIHISDLVLNFHAPCPVSHISGGRGYPHSKKLQRQALACSAFSAIPTESGSVPHRAERCGWEAAPQAPVGDVGCRVYCGRPGCECQLCICVCVCQYTPSWDVHGVGVWALGVFAATIQVHNTALHYMINVVCEVCGMVRDLSVSYCAMHESECTLCLSFTISNTLAV